MGRCNRKSQRRRGGPGRKRRRGGPGTQRRRGGPGAQRCERLRAAPPEAKLTEVDPTHVYYSLNTEYEIFRCVGTEHTLGALFILNHKTPFTELAPPVTPLLSRTRAEGALLELDKHNWPWSMMLVPILKVDLYELTNNHIWRTNFHFKDFAEPAPGYMNIETDAAGFTERGWIDFGLQNYYTLLNCGFDMMPTAGTASGVHPVPLGFGRVYVQLSEPFNYDAWLRGLKAGHSFVTTGPMLFATLDSQSPGHRFETDEAKTFTLEVRAQSPHPIQRVEIVINGAVQSLPLPPAKTLKSGAQEISMESPIDVDESAWVAVRCFSDAPEGRPRFAHTAPFHITVPGKPLRLRVEETAFLAERMEQQIKRHEGVLSEAAVGEYKKALQIYRGLPTREKE